MVRRRNVVPGFHLRAERFGGQVSPTSRLSNPGLREVGVQPGARGWLMFLRFVEVQIRHVIAGTRQRALPVQDRACRLETSGQSTCRCLRRDGPPGLQDAANGAVPPRATSSRETHSSRRRNADRYCPCGVPRNRDKGVQPAAAYWTRGETKSQNKATVLPIGYNVDGE